MIYILQSQTEEGVFGSKFVTVCITGNKDCEVEMMAYQVRWFKMLDEIIMGLMDIFLLSDL